MSTENTINFIERNIKEAKKLKELHLAVEKLQNNREFRAVIKEGYFEKEAQRLVHLLGDENCQSVEKRAAIIKQMDGIAALNSYFNTITVLASQAEKSIAMDEAMLEELRAGDTE